MIGRTRGGTEAVPEEQFDMVGTTGNIYTVTIGKQPTCSCPDSRKGNQCKHIVYVCLPLLPYFLRVPTNGGLGPSQCAESAGGTAVSACASFVSE